MDDESPADPSECFVGVKPFERALVKLITTVAVSLPSCFLHPLVPGDDGHTTERVCWEDLHAEVHPAGNAAGGALPATRVQRKCWQLESLISISRLLSDGLQEARGTDVDHAASKRPSCHLVDFAGGCGPLGLPLAALMPHALVTIVELKKRSLDIARAKDAAAGLTNVRFFEGDLSAFAEAFDIGLALHACGTASDLVLDVCVAARACFVICPCCTGKVSEARKDGYRFQATGSSEGRVTYPRSRDVAAVLSSGEYNFLACAADVSDEALLRGRRGMLRRLAKTYLEHDRLLWAAERAYEVRFTRMPEPGATPKRDILCGWPTEQPPSLRVMGCLSRHAARDDDLSELLRLRQMMRDAGEAGGGADEAGAAGGSEGGNGPAAAASERSSNAGSSTQAPKHPGFHSGVHLGALLAASEWDPEELAQVRATLEALGDGQILIVAASSARRRRLVHFAADALGLHHVTVAGDQRPDRAHPGAVQVQRFKQPSAAAAIATCAATCAAEAVVPSEECAPFSSAVLEVEEDVALF